MIQKSQSNVIISFIEAAIGCGAGISGCEESPSFIKKAYPNFNWMTRIECVNTEKGWDGLDDISIFNINLGSSVYAHLLNGEKVCVVGGDHSCGIGTWSGLSLLGDVGLIWLDAHLDGHTDKTSPSQNIHGMALAALLGHGDEKLTKVLGKYPKLKAENLCIIGVRSYEVKEYELLKQLGVKIYFEKEVQEIGLKQILDEAYRNIKSNVDIFGISLDADFFNPEEIQCVGTPVAGGFSIQETLDALQHFPKEDLKVFEFVELNPRLGCHKKTINDVGNFLSWFGAE